MQRKCSQTRNHKCFNSTRCSDLNHVQVASHPLFGHHHLHLKKYNKKSPIALCACMRRIALCACMAVHACGAPSVAAAFAYTCQALYSMGIYLPGVEWTGTLSHAYGVPCAGICRHLRAAEEGAGHARGFRQVCPAFWRRSWYFDIDIKVGGLAKAGSS